MKKQSTALLLISTALTLSGCDTFRNTLGLDHYQADEFNIAENPPLSMPPSYNLAPPTSANASDNKTRDENTTQKAKETLLGRKEKTTEATTNSAKAVVAKANETQKADPEIRTTIAKEESSLASESDSFPDTLSKMGQKIAKNAKNTSNEDDVKVSHSADSTPATK